MGGKRANNIDVAVGHRIRLFRLNAGLSQTELADQIGVTFQQVQKYEVGANRIGTGRLVRIAAILDIPIAALLEGTAGADPAGSLLALIDDRRSFRLAHAFELGDDRPDPDAHSRLNVVVRRRSDERGPR